VIKSEVKFTAHADRALEVLAAGGSRSGDLAGG
jgi:hypothetical protein